MKIKQCSIRVALLTLATLCVDMAQAEDSPWSVFVGPAHIRFSTDAKAYANGTVISGGNGEASSNNGLSFGANYQIDPYWTARLTLGLPPTTTLTHRGFPASRVVGVPVVHAGARCSEWASMEARSAQDLLCRSRSHSDCLSVACAFRFLDQSPLSMNIEILPDQPATERRKLSGMQLEFERLSKTLQREQKKQQKFFAEIDRLCRTYDEKVLPEMKNNHGMLRNLLSRLIDFSTRKSLSQWHREELEEWIHELLEQIGQYDHLDAKAAAQLYMDLQRHHFGTPTHIPDDEDEFDPFVEDDPHDSGPQDRSASQQGPEDRADDAQQDFFGFDDIPEPEGSESEEDEYAEIPFADEAFEPEPQLDDKWFKQLFRRAAQVLHPDREQDPERQQEKKQLMSALLQARDDNDMLTLLELYQQHVDDDRLQVPEHAFEALCDSIEDKLEQLEMEKLGYLYANPQRFRVHQLLYAGTSKKQQKNLEQLLQDIRQLGRELPEIAQSLRNLTSLKRELEWRREVRFELMLEQGGVFF